MQIIVKIIASGHEDIQKLTAMHLYKMEKKIFLKAFCFC